MWDFIAAVNWESVGKSAAVFSALFSAYAAYNSRRLVASMILAQKLSIRPIVQIVYGDYENRIFVTIENRGLGPMVIEKVEVVKAGEDLMKGGQDAGHSSLVYAADFPFVEEYVDDFDGNLVGRVLQQGGETVLFRAKGESSDENFLKYLSDLRMYLAGVEFIVHYKDMYDVHQAPSRRSGLWFGRHFKSDADIELKTLTRQHA